MQRKLFYAIICKNTKIFTQYFQWELWEGLLHSPSHYWGVKSLGPDFY